MTTINGTNALTLIELAKRKDPNGSITNIIEVLTEENTMFLDAPWVEANGQMQHKALAVMNPIPMKFRNSEDIALADGLGQNWASKMLYGNESFDPRQFTGFAPRMNALTAKRVLDAGGTGSDLTSVYAIQWGENTCHMVYPIGHPNHGVESRDMGTDIVLDSNSNEYVAYRTHFKIYGGLVVRDDRAVKRLANIETASGASSNIFDDDLMLELVNEFRHGGKGVVLYVNRTSKTQMD